MPLTSSLNLDKNLFLTDFFLFEQIKHLHIELTKKVKKIKKLITTKLTINKTRCKKVTPGI